MPGAPLCPHCRETVAADARACPHCRNATFTDLRIEAPLADARKRYQLARALAAVPGVPPISAAQAALAARGGMLLRGALPGLAQVVAALLAEHAVAHVLEPAAAAAAPATRAGPRRLRPARLAAAIGLLAAGIAGLALVWRGQHSRTGEGTRLSGAELARRALPSTVAIHCQGSVGSGFFVAPGLVLTSEHVVCPPGQPMTVRLPDGTEGSGQVSRYDDRLDLALVQVAGIDAPPLPLGDAGTLSVGDRVMVVGSPKGMEFSVSQGGVSSLDRVYLGVAMIQTDTPINPGNSGGPIPDERGRVVGVVALKRRDAEGISLALPINYAFTGPEALVESPLPGESEGFRRMAARADAEDDSEAARLKATGQRPGLMGAMPQLDQTIAAEIWWPAPGNPGPQGFDFDLVSRGAAACALHAEVSEWQRAQGNDGGSALKPRMKT